MKKLLLAAALSVSAVLCASEAHAQITAPANRRALQDAGIYSATPYYAAADVVTYAGVYYESLVSNNHGNNPSTDNGSHWQALAPPLNGATILSGLGYVPARTPTLPSNLSSALMAAYDFAQGTGTTLVDVSGKNFCGGAPCNGTFDSTNPPTWLSRGVAMDIHQGIALPAALNSVRSVVIAAYHNPISLSPGGTMKDNVWPSLLTSSLGSTGHNLLLALPDGVQGAPAIWNGSTQTAAQNYGAGFQIYVVTYGTGTAGDLDRLYVGGNEVSYVMQGSTANAQSSGYMYLGTSNISPWDVVGLDGVMYSARFFSTKLTPDDVQAITEITRAEVQAAGVPTSPVPYNYAGPQFHCIGDSIVAGPSAMQAWCANLSSSLLNQPTYTFNNWGIGGVKLAELAIGESDRVGRACKVASSGRSVAIVAAGTNDMGVRAGTTADVTSLIFSFMAGEIAHLKEAGCVVGVSTMLDRMGTSNGSRTWSADKNAFNILIRKRAIAAGADFIADVAAVPTLGADGAAAGAAFIDGVHPTATSHTTLMVPAIANALNAYFGATAANPTVFTAASTMTAADRFVRAAPTASMAITLPSCLGQSGVAYVINNPQSTYTVTLKTAASSQPINGTDYSSSGLTLPTGSTTLLDVPNDPSVAGCHWER